MSAETRYAALVERFCAMRGVTSVAAGKGFGSSGQLKLNGRIFAMLVRGDLVLSFRAPAATSWSVRVTVSTSTPARGRRCANG